MRTIEVPEELLDFLKGSRLAGRSETEQVKIAVAIHLFQEGLISVGRAAALAVSRASSRHIFPTVAKLDSIRGSRVSGSGTV